MPLLGALMPVLAQRPGRVACAVAAAIPTAVALALLLHQAPAVFAGVEGAYRAEWVPQIGPWTKTNEQECS